MQGVTEAGMTITDISVKSDYILPDSSLCEWHIHSCDFGTMHRVLYFVRQKRFDCITVLLHFC